MLPIRPDLWTHESKKEYSSIVFSSAVIHFPLGLVLLISGILVGELSNYLDLVVGVTLLSSGVIAVFSTIFPSFLLIVSSGLVGVGSGLLSVAFFISTIVIITLKQLTVTNPLGWIYLVYAAFACFLEVMQLYMGYSAVRHATFVNRARNYSQSVPLASDHGAGRNVVEVQSPTGTKPTYFNSKDAKLASSSS